eukprot:CAMPEP_0117684134 /NCGR_PEP_ID=MMETSP0804-20121206/20890_1 /TAXON_ID=1074897 /ORGANISM="Tetraselmis astigmatica, Strain CCMP880" /LENGTH=62 /DNA_ID=CAMNT_0005495011 /DNA_START=113 /DNA_END=301 /DNA_ORIENTATION=+
MGTVFRAAAAGIIALGSKGAALAKSAGGVKGVSLLAGAGAAAAAGATCQGTAPGQTGPPETK